MSNNSNHAALLKAKEAYNNQKIIVNDREYGFHKASFKEATQLAAFAESIDGVEWLGSDQFHNVIKPILLQHITYKDMRLSNQESYIESDQFMGDAIELLSTALLVLCYPLLQGLM